MTDSACDCATCRQGRCNERGELFRRVSSIGAGWKLSGAVWFWCRTRTGAPVGLCL